MVDYSKNWEKSGDNKNYLDIADIILQDRIRLIKILISYFNHFFKDRNSIKVLDLGCGDGILTKHLHSNRPDISYAVCDGSLELINKAKQNLQNIKDCQYYNISFEDIINTNALTTKFDFIISSFAIHHISHDIKYSFFDKLFSLLNENGHFVNIDTCLSSNITIDNWYYNLWQEWIIEIQKLNNIEKDYSDIPHKAPKKPENHYQNLDIQLQWLTSIGFNNVDCHYKYGLFCIYGGCK